MDRELEMVKNKHRAIDAKIREAKERQGRGEETPYVQLLRELLAAKANQPKEEKQAANRDYLRKRGRDREMRSKFEKTLDALRGDL